MTPNLSRRRLLSLASFAAAGTGILAGCGYRPGGGDIRWEAGVGTGGYMPDDVLAAGDGEALFAVNRSSRGFDWDTEEWGEYGDVTVYDADSGDERAREETDPITCSAVAGRTLYVGHEDGELTAVGADGEVGWRTEIDGVPRTLAASADRVYAATDQGDLAALATEDGERLWRSEPGNPDDRVELAADRDGAYVHRDDTTTSTEVLRFGPNGERRWRASLAAHSAGNTRLVAVDDALYVPTRGTLFALGRRDGTERWSREIGVRRGPPVVTDDAVLCSDGETLRAVGGANGEERWRFRPEGRWQNVSPPAATGGVAYVCGREALHALDVTDGSVRWRAESESVEDAPTVVGRTVVVATTDGYLRGHWRE